MTHSEKVALVMAAIRSDGGAPPNAIASIEIAVSEIFSISDSLRRIAVALEKGTSP